jgi:hypothetical protein
MCEALSECLQIWGSESPLTGVRLWLSAYKFEVRNYRLEVWGSEWVLTNLKLWITGYKREALSECFQSWGSESPLKGVRLWVSVYKFEVLNHRLDACLCCISLFIYIVVLLFVGPAESLLAHCSLSRLIVLNPAFSSPVHLQSRSKSGGVRDLY